MELQPKTTKVSPATGASKSSTSPVQKGVEMRQATQVSSKGRAKLLSMLVLITAVLAPFASAKDIEFERGSDAAAATAAQAAHVALNAAGISCSVDSAYGPDFLWTKWYGNALLTIDAAGVSSLVLFDDDGEGDTICSDESSVRVMGAIEIEFSQTADGGQYLVRTTGRSMGFVQISAREMTARIVGASGAVTFR